MLGLHGVRLPSGFYELLERHSIDAEDRFISIVTLVHPCHNWLGGFTSSGLVFELTETFTARCPFARRSVAFTIAQCPDAVMERDIASLIASVFAGHQKDSPFFWPAFCFHNHSTHCHDLSQWDSPVVVASMPEMLANEYRS